MATEGNSNMPVHYDLTDKDPLEGWSYYRLRQTDNDGTQTVSHVVSVQYRNRLRAITIHPIPADDQINVGLDLDAPGQLTLAIHDLLGRTVQQRSLQLEAGRQDVRTDLVNVPAGNYLLRVVLDGQAYTRLIEVY